MTSKKEMGTIPNVPDRIPSARVQRNKTELGQQITKPEQGAIIVQDTQSEPLVERVIPTPDNPIQEMRIGLWHTLGKYVKTGT